MHIRLFSNFFQPIAKALRCVSHMIVAAAVALLLPALLVPRAYGQCPCGHGGEIKLAINGEGTLAGYYGYIFTYDVLQLSNTQPPTVVAADAWQSEAPVSSSTPIFTRMRGPDIWAFPSQVFKINWNNPGHSGSFALNFATCGGKVELSTMSATSGFFELPGKIYLLPDIKQGTVWLRVKNEGGDSKPGDYKADISGGRLEGAGIQTHAAFNLAVNLGSVSDGESAGSMVISDDILNLLQPTPDFGSYIYSKAMVNVDRTQVSVTSSAGIITLTRNSNSSVIGRVVKMSSTEAKFEAYDSLDGSPLRTITLALVSGGIQVTDSRDPSNPVIYGGAALGYGWTKSGDGVSESGESVINSSGEREETITSTAGTSVKRIYRFGYGPATQTHELLTAVVMDSGAGGLNLTTSYEYWDSGIQINRLKRVINPDGSWICYTFGRDASRYYEREYSPTAGNATSPVPDDAMLSSYDSGTGFDGRKVVRTYIDSLAEARLESEIEWINSNRVSRTEYEYSGTATTTITEIEKKFIDSTNYLATKSVRYGANLAADQWKAGRIISQGGPDYNIDSCKSSGSC